MSGVDCPLCGGLRFPKHATSEQAEWLCRECGEHSIEERAGS